MLGFALGEHHDAQLVYGAMAVAVRGVIMHTDQGSEYTAGAFHAACARLGISRSPPSVLLRENYRESGKVKNRTLANLSAWPEHKVEALSRALKGLPPAGLDGTFVVARSLPHGHVATVLGTIRQLGLEELIDAAPSRARNLVAVMITAAVIDGSSKLATARGLRAQTAASTSGEVFGLGSCDEDDLYAAVDLLGPRQQAIEDALAARHLVGGTLVQYDVSSAASGGRTCPLGAIGHAGDGVRGRLQIVYGVLTATEGIPVAVQIFRAALATRPRRPPGPARPGPVAPARRRGQGRHQGHPQRRAGTQLRHLARRHRRQPRSARRRSARLHHHHHPDTGPAAGLRAARRYPPSRIPVVRQHQIPTHFRRQMPYPTPSRGNFGLTGPLRSWSRSSACCSLNRVAAWTALVPGRVKAVRAVR